jgi:DNA-binding NarL/FixJ family response regulator
VRVGATVLIVDNCPRFHAAAAELLTDRGLGIFGTAVNGDQAIGLTADGCPDGILVDIALSGPDGFTVAAALALICPSARIVLTSASVDRVPDELLRASGAIAFVMKDQLAGSDLARLFSPAGR